MRSFLAGYTNLLVVTKPMMASPRKLRMLMLHGWGQTGPIFRDKTRAFARKLEKLADLVYVSAPHEIPGVRADGDVGYGWWYYHEEDRSRLPVEGFSTRTHTGWPASRLAIASAWKDGPVDVVCGFSQGAVAVHLLLSELQAALKHGQVADWHKDPAAALMLSQPPQAAIMTCGFPSGYAAANAGLPEGALLATRSLHFSATEDAVVPSALHAALHACFAPETAALHTYAQGHMMPQRAGDVSVAADFLSRLLAPAGAAGAASGGAGRPVAALPRVGKSSKVAAASAPPSIAADTAATAVGPDDETAASSACAAPAGEAGGVEVPAALAKV